MQICNNFLPVPVLAELSLPSLPEKVESRGEARESTTVAAKAVRTAGAERNSDSRGGQNNVLGRTKGRGGGSRLGCFQLPFASPDFVVDDISQTLYLT